jgi:hypothetical protein
VCGLREWVCLCAACTRNRGWRAAARRDRSRTKGGNSWSEKRWMEHGAQSMDSPVWLPAQSPIQTGLARRERSDGATSKEGGRGAHMAMCSCSKHPIPRQRGCVAAWQGAAGRGMAWMANARALLLGLVGVPWWRQSGVVRRPGDWPGGAKKGAKRAPRRDEGSRQGREGGEQC